jgi:hypothetical protein
MTDILLTLWLGCLIEDAIARRMAWKNLKKITRRHK